MPGLRAGLPARLRLNNLSDVLAMVSHVAGIYFVLIDARQPPNH